MARYLVQESIIEKNIYKKKNVFLLINFSLELMLNT